MDVYMQAAVGDPLTFKDIATPVIASLSLFFTLATFWWNNWRRGKITVDHPRSYSVRRVNGRMLLVIPLMLQNTGARSLSVVALRMRARTGSLLPYTRLHPKLNSDKSEITFATGFMVSGRDSMLLTCEFESQDPQVLHAGANEFYLDILYSRRKKWRQGQVVTLTATEELLAQVGQRSIAFDNAQALPVNISKGLNIWRR